MDPPGLLSSCHDRASHRRARDWEVFGLFKKEPSGRLSSCETKSDEAVADGDRAVVSAFGRTVTVRLTPDTTYKGLRPLGASVTLATLVIAFAAVTACRDRAHDAPRSHLVERAGVAMGSELRLTAWTRTKRRRGRRSTRSFREFDRLDSLMSVWRPGSDVLRVNAAAGTHAVPVGADVREALRTAQQISEWTGGKFDVTFGALADVWKFDHDQDNTIPDPGGDSRPAAADRLPADRDRRSAPARSF